MSVDTEANQRIISDSIAIYAHHFSSQESCLAAISVSLSGLTELEGILQAVAPLQQEKRRLVRFRCPCPMEVRGLPIGAGAWAFSSAFRKIIDGVEAQWGGKYYNYKIVEPDQVEATVQELLDLGVPKKCIEVV